MEEDKEKVQDALSSDIGEIIQERNRLERILREKFKKEVAILFTDICNYTEYTDTYGDINGRALLQKYNQIVLPSVANHEGTVVKTIGDAIMVSFPSPLEAVKASTDIMKEVDEYNQTIETVDKIHMKIGINAGQALVDDGDIYGDVVNVASRIQVQAGPDQILISTNIYEKIRGADDILCRFHGTVWVKGKPEPLELYRVVWRDEDIVFHTGKRARAYEGFLPGEDKKARKVIRLEVALEDTRLKISVHEHMAGEESTIRHYEEMPVSLDWIEAKGHEMVEALNAVNRQGRFTREVLIKLRETGRIFYEELLTPSVKARLKETKAEYLNLHIDDQLVQVPWELLYDGQEFLCQRFSMGRSVKTRQEVLGMKNRVLAKPLRMLIIANPEGDLKGAYKEGVQIQRHMDQYREFIAVTLRSENTSPASLKEKMKYFDIIHFAGHADYDLDQPAKGGWRLARESLTAQDIMAIPGASPMPALIFSNACQSARTEDWLVKEHFQDKIFGLANAFLLAGVKHYVGTFWEILDEPSSRFAQDFYKYLLSGLTIGEALREARLSSIKKYGEETIVWSSYLLYGDPTSNYMEQIKISEEKTEQEAADGMDPEEEIKLQGPIPDLAEREKSRKSYRRWGMAAAAGFFSFLGLIFFLSVYQPSQEPMPQNQSLPSEILQSQPAGAIMNSDFLQAMQIIRLLSSYQDLLSNQYKGKGFFTGRERESESWTSTPISICMISPHWEGLDPYAAGSLKPHFQSFFQKMTEIFTQTQSMGLHILERERLPVVLQELQIGTSDISAHTLKDVRTLLSARVILFPELITYKVNQHIQSEVSLRLVETASTEIIGAFSCSLSPQLESIKDTASHLVNQTMKTLQRRYLPQGLITSIDGQTVEINLGSSIGISQGQSFFVLGKTERDQPKGTVQVQATYEHTALATILEQQRQFNVGDRIKAIPPMYVSENRQP
ncbi:MAG: CHAT domain-containing protein [bacterium]